MTLVLTWVAPDGIVMGVDSAISWRRPDGNIDYTLSDTHKVFTVDRAGFTIGISFAGAAKLRNEWIPVWLQKYLDGYAGPSTIFGFANALASQLNSELPAASDLLAFQIAGWERSAGTRTPGDIEPKFFEVSNLDRANTAKTATFSVADILPADFVQDIRDYRNGNRLKGYPMRFGSAGIPRLFSTQWIARTLIPAYKSMIEAQVPQPNVASIAEFVRFLIEAVADLQRISRQPATVNKPVETLLLFPDFHHTFSIRYY